MSLPFFSPDPIWATELLAVGYQLFPCNLIPLHSRLTILSGNNGVGKTTLLDVIQTVILCHQQYISMNVASGQNDRSIVGQLRQRIAWAAIGIDGHEEVTALGVRLAVRPSGEQVDLSPFILRRLPLATSLFLSPETNTITADFQVLSRRILQADPTADCLPFERVDDYHSFLHEQGILPIALMRPGKKKTFAGLWRQITQPRLTDLQSFLQDMLCPPPVRKMNFSDVERLMQDRRSVEDRLQRLVRFREIRHQLEELSRALDTARQKALAMDCILTLGRVQSLEEQTKAVHEEQDQAQQGLDAQEVQLLALIGEETQVSRQRDQCLRQQSSLDVQLQRHKEYQEQGLTLSEAEARLQVLDAQLTDLGEQLRKIQEELSIGDRECSQLTMEQFRWQEKEKQLQKDVRTWQDFNADLVQATDLVGQKITTLPDVIDAWNTWHEPYQRLRLVPEWKEQLKALRSRVQEHERALVLWQGLKETGSVTGSPVREDAERSLGTIKETIIALNLRQEKITQERKDIQVLRDTLAQGRPPMPPEAQRMVDQGLADPVAKDFDQLNVQEATIWQTRLGPFALAIRPRDGIDLRTQLQGPDRIFILDASLEDQDWSSWGQFLGGHGPLTWYEPQGPVWLSHRARAEQMVVLEKQLHDLDQALAQVKLDLTAQTSVEEKYNALLGAWKALEDAQSVPLAQELARKIDQILEKEAQTKACFICLDKIKQRVQLFDLADSPAQLELVGQRLGSLAHELKILDATLTQLRLTQKELTKKLGPWEKEREDFFAQKVKALAVRQILEQEEPLDVLEGRVDFTKAKALAERIAVLDQTLAGLKKQIRAGEGRKGQLLSDVRHLSSRRNILTDRLALACKDQDQAQAAWRDFYPQDDPRAVSGQGDEAQRARVHQEWAQCRAVLSSSLDMVCREYGQVFSMPQDREPDALVADVLALLLPMDVQLDLEEEKLKSLRDELAKIEAKLRGYVQAIRNNVDADIRVLTRKLQRINEVLTNLGFGQVRKVYLEKIYEPSYEGLKRLRGIGQLPLFSSGAPVGLGEFLDQIRETIARHAKGIQLEDDQITDYRTYVRLHWAIEDEKGCERRSGFSGGETLGINLAICLSLLFYEGSDSGRERGSGILLMALDEAERLDERAMNTVRNLLDRVECQLVLALPRVLQIPDSLTHILTALPQGVTHVGMYMPEETESTNAFVELES